MIAIIDRFKIAGVTFHRLPWW